MTNERSTSKREFINKGQREALTQNIVRAHSSCCHRTDRLGSQEQWDDPTRPVDHASSWFDQGGFPEPVNIF